MSTFAEGASVTFVGGPEVRVTVQKFNPDTGKYLCSWKAGNKIVTEEIAPSALRELSPEEAYPYRYQ